MADELDGVASRHGRDRQHAARLDPLPGQVEILQTGQGLAHPCDTHLHGLLGQQPAGGVAHPIASVALVAERCGHVGHLDLAAQAGINLFQEIDDDLGDLGLLGIVQLAAVDVLPVGVIRADHDLDDRFSRRGQAGIKAVVLDADLVVVFPGDQQRFVQQVGDPVRLAREIPVHA